jgi:hypothetical protein
VFSRLCFVLVCEGVELQESVGLGLAPSIVFFFVFFHGT